MVSSSERLGGLPDGALLARVARADVAAFEVFYDRHVVSAHALAARIVRGPQPADDVCQEAFLAAWRAASAFDAALGNARSWILQIVRNRAIDHLRRTRRLREHEVTDESLALRHPGPPSLETEHAALRNVHASEMHGALGVLSDDQREVIGLGFYGGYSHAEIAERLGLPLGTVKARMKRGLVRMRDALTD